jgi:hypothetical protein
MYAAHCLRPQLKACHSIKVCAKALAVGSRKSFSVYIGQGDFETDLVSRR